MKTKSSLPLICIVGPTSTGKTGLALKLSKQLKSNLISADSRQVYRGMDIVTGKDHPTGIKLAGIDLVYPDEECSVSLWYQAINPFLSTDKLKVAVGGTGLYIKAITEGIPTISIPLNPSLRKKLELESVLELQARLQVLNSTRFSKLNHSDSHNPRRLIRAIEIESSSSGHNLTSSLPSITQNRPSLIIGLRPPDIVSYSRLIKTRVLARLKKGAIKETKELITKYEKNLPALSAIGYRSLISFLEGEISKEEMINNWVSDELSYAKRQLTWFNKVSSVTWFPVEDPLIFPKVTSLVEKFIHSCYDNR